MHRTERIMSSVVALLSVGCSVLVDLPVKEDASQDTLDGADTDAVDTAHEAVDVVEALDGDGEGVDEAMDGDVGEGEGVDNAEDGDVYDPCSVYPRWYRDYDTDTYGSDDDTVCTAEAPAGYVARGGDCCDTDSLVHQGQAEWFTASYRCPSAGWWDYNCDGTVTMRYMDQHECPQALSGGGWGCRYDDFTPGWLASTPPACGTTAVYVIACPFSGSSPSDYCYCPCSTTEGFWLTEDRTQSCR